MAECPHGRAGAGQTAEREEAGPAQRWRRHSAGGRGQSPGGGRDVRISAELATMQRYNGWNESSRRRIFTMVDGPGIM